MGIRWPDSQYILQLVKPYFLLLLFLLVVTSATQQQAKKPDSVLMSMNADATAVTSADDDGKQSFKKKREKWEKPHSFPSLCLNILSHSAPSWFPLPHHLLASVSLWC